MGSTKPLMGFFKFKSQGQISPCASIEQTSIATKSLSEWHSAANESENEHYLAL